MAKELKNARKALESAVALRDEKVGDLEKIVQSAATETRDFTPQEYEARGRLSVEIEQANKNVREAEDSVATIEKARREARKAERAAAARVDNGYAYETDGDGVITRNSTKHTYERGGPHGWLKDLVVSSIIGHPGRRAADNRLAAHAREMHQDLVEIDKKYPTARTAEEAYMLRQGLEGINQRGPDGGPRNYRDLSTTTGAGGEFVPPLFDTKDWIEFLRAARALADCQNNQPLPDGTMGITLPKVTGGTAVASQNSQNTGVEDQDLSTAFVTFPVVTKAGQQKLSLQLLERSPIDFSRVVMQDLGRAYAQVVDVAVATGNGVGSGNYDINGGTDVTGILNTEGINIISWTQSHPGIPGLYGQIGQAKADVANTIFQPATHCFMTPTRWEWLASQFDANQRPLVVPTYQGPFNAAILNTDGAVAEGAVGRKISGLDTFEDANLPTTVGTDQDVILIGKFDENYLYESPQVFRVLPQTYGNQLEVLLQVYGYMAFTAARYPTANAVITGTGLVYPPTFAS